MSQPSQQTSIKTQSKQSDLQDDTPNAHQVSIVREDCMGCPSRAAHSTLFNLSYPGRCFCLPCGQIHCKACLTESHLARYPMLHPITCSICNTAASFTQTYQGPYVLNALPCSIAYFTSVRDMDILNSNSPNYAAGDACIVDSNEYRAVLSFIYHFTPHPAEGVVPFNLPSSTIFRILSNYLGNGLRVITPELLETELKIVFDNLVRQQDSPYRGLLPNCTTEDAKVNHERQ
jgi:hypothetical protein